ncbi:hypothetical protein WJX73_003089 [Symbiochloris irregularis]|uniref:Uncharacterized protein n=1 Tax=Symbiochloris irregularis TaxID=706552 RepID=A0AAW1NLT9_9CHLO
MHLLPRQHRYVNAAALAAPMPLDTEEINPRCEVPSPFSAAAITAPAPPAPPSVLGKRPAVADIHSSSSPELGKGSKVVEDVAKKPKKNDRLTQMHITIKPATLPLPADVIENNTPAATTTVTTAVPSSNPHDTGGSSSSSTASNVSTTDADPFPRPVMISTAGRWRHQFHNQLMGRPQDLQGDPQEAWARGGFFDGPRGSTSGQEEARGTGMGQYTRIVTRCKWSD